MKKFIAGVAAAALLSGGAVVAEGALVSSNAAGVVRVADGDYGPTQPQVKKTIRNIKKQIRQDDITGIKAGKLIQKLRNYRKAGLLSNAKFKKLRAQLKDAI